jgi:hypothetical protein
MSCENYGEALIDAAAATRALEGGLAEHLTGCAQCRARLQREHALFAAIDDALRRRVNESPREGFLPRIRARIRHEAESNAGWSPMWAGAALALLLLAIAHPWTVLRQHLTEGSLNDAPLYVLQRSVRKSSEAPQLVHGSSEISGMREPSRRHSAEHFMARQSARHELEVLVPSDEAKAFAQFVARVAGRDEIAAAVVRPAKDKLTAANSELPEVRLLDIAELQLRPQQWEESDEAWDPE